MFVKIGHMVKRFIFGLKLVTGFIGSSEKITVISDASLRHSNFISAMSIKFSSSSVNFIRFISKFKIGPGVNGGGGFGVGGISTEFCFSEFNFSRVFA
jgi:hypothetical protein